MPMIADNVRAQLAEILKTLSNEVTILLFTQKEGCHFCTLARELLEELTALSGKLKLEIHDFVENSGLAAKYVIDKTPAIVLLGEKDYGIRFYGIPAGHEFTALVEDLIDVSRRDPGLPKDIAGELAKVNQPVHIQVMISPSWPYCARAVRTAHRFAMANENIVSDMIELAEFPDIAEKYNVQGVPKIIINDTHVVTGEMPEADFAQEILKAVSKELPVKS